MPVTDPYQILGVAKSATQAEIRRAYNTIAKQHHPDRNPGNVESLERFVEATQAYETLSDPVHRAAADAAIRSTRDQATMNYDSWGEPLWNPPSSIPESETRRYPSLGEEPWTEPPYGAIAAIVALLGITGLVLATFLFV